MVTNPILGFGANRLLATSAAAVIAALTGAALKRACIGRRYDYEMGEPDPDIRPATDLWLLHAGLVLAAGAATGGAVAAFTPGCCTQAECVLGGIACALLFVPVCLAVIAAARRGQRARLGSIVATSDRRAVWAILAMLLAVMTLEGLPDWPSSTLGITDAPLPVVGMLAAAALGTLGIFFADYRALSRARGVVARGLSAHDPAEPAADAEDAARVDLGLGDEVLVELVRGAAAYRQRARAVALVKGAPGAALSALQRAVRRGVIGLTAITVAGMLHACAATGPAAASYGSLICTRGYPTACELAEHRLAERDPEKARSLFRRIRAWRGEAP
jgi:hypothetical protein